jgi:flagellar assembly factor FliW
MMATAIEQMQSIESQLLGQLTVADDQRVTFPAGLYGFPEARDFVLLPTPRSGLFWLQSVQHSPLTFLLVDPFQVFASYHVDLTDNEVARLGSKSKDDLLVLSIVTLPRENDQAWTANLHAPLLFNVCDKVGFQSIRSDDAFGVCEPFVVEADPQ